MKRSTLLLALSLVACGGTPEPATEIPPSAEMPNDGAMKHEDGPQYACPMHPEETAHAPGDCSKCGMALVLQEPSHHHNDHGEGDDEH
jgi:hypothetical protein